MMNKERARLVERYINGSMSQMEHQRFKQQLSEDAELRRMLDAEQLIGTVLANDREAMPRDHRRTKTKVAAALAAVSAPAAYSTAQAAAGSGATGLLAGITGKLIVVATLSVLTVGAIVLPELFEEPTEQIPVPAVQAAPETSPQSVVQEDIPVPESLPVTEEREHISIATEAEQSVPREVKSAPAVRTEQSVAHPSPPNHVIETDAESAGKVSTLPTEPINVEEANRPQRTHKEPSPVITDDEVKLDIQLDMEGLNGKKKE